MTDRDPGQPRDPGGAPDGAAGHDRAGLAAEYALGTLDAGERAAAAALLATDPAFAAQVAAWERRLGELHAMVEPVPPPAALWGGLAARLPPATPVAGAAPVAGLAPAVGLAPAASLASADQPSAVSPPPSVAPPAVVPPAAPGSSALDPSFIGPPPEPPPEPSHDPSVGGSLPSLARERALVVHAERPPDDDAAVARLARRVQGWRSAAAGLAAFSLALATLTVLAALAPDLLPMGLRPSPRLVEVPREVVRSVEVPGPAPGRHIAVLQPGGTAPAFVVTLDSDRKSLMVRRLSPEDEGDKRYELWLVSDRLPAPRSLGLLGPETFTIVPAIAAFDREIIETAVYAVSLEPSAGSPIDGPSGPVSYSGRAVEAVPVLPAEPPGGG
ncbi:hypothetical protein GJ689_21635 [Rhodoplanes serenus]|uniref:Regulator of SigK n=1 Tax=Rhodoplanes serenus TaxID=200615 RepID=A0A9X4XP53_9BRAD|nr:anti-sigma factor [Rhodoplanes serenus]MTW18805.1 hypothetical protein [Rhodoplanes serenus]